VSIADGTLFPNPFEPCWINLWPSSAVNYFWGFIELVPEMEMEVIWTGLTWTGSG